MKEVEQDKKLTQAYLKSILKYCAKTGNFTWLVAPNRRIRVGQMAGSMCHDYPAIRINSKLYLAHRLVWLYTYGYFPNGDKFQMDHIDGDKSNNKLVNLREATRSENMRNKPHRQKKKLSVKGVYQTRNGTFRTTITNPSTKIVEYLGTYLTLQEAYNVYQTKAREYDREFYYNNH